MSETIAIYGSRRQEAHLGELAKMFRLFQDCGFQASVHPKLAAHLRDRGVDMCGARESVWVPADAKLVVSIGGDGTFLRASRWVGDREIPVLGVNTGHLGFLSSCRIEEFADVLGEICNGNVAVERRMMLEVECASFGMDVWPYALNEVAFLREDTASMVTVSTEVNGDFLADFRCDGLIVSTPTGSTAYNLSAGGPILQPTLECMAIAAVAPHTLTVRPVVVGGESVLDFRVTGRAGAFRLSLDGTSHTVPVGERVRIRRAGFSTMLVRRTAGNFATVLRDKLLWGANLC